MTAQRLLVERHRISAAVPLLIAVLKDKHRIPWRGSMPSGRLAGIERRRCGRLGPDGRATLTPACASMHSASRRRSKHAHHERLLPTASLVALADDPAIRVRLQAALALGDRCRDEPAALDALGRIAAKDADDPWMRLAILSGLAESSLAFIPLCDRDPLSRRAGPNCWRRPPRSWGSAGARPSWPLCWE